MHAAFQIDERPAAVARFDGNRNLDHRHAFDVAPCRDHALRNAVLEAERITEREHGGALLQEIRIAERQSRQLVGIDAEDGEIKLAVGGVNLGDFAPSAIGELDGDGPGFADDVQAGCNQAVGRNHKACANPVFLSVASVMFDDHHGFERGGGECLNGLGVTRPGLVGTAFRHRCLLGRIKATWREQQQHPKTGGSFCVRLQESLFSGSSLFCGSWSEGRHRFAVTAVPQVQHSVLSPGYDHGTIRRGRDRVLEIRRALE